MEPNVWIKFVFTLLNGINKFQQNSGGQRVYINLYKLFINSLQKFQ